MGIGAQFYKAGALLGGALMFMSNVKADDAASNIASYPKFFGLDGLAENLSGVGVDATATKIAIALLILSVLLWWVGRPNRKTGNVYEEQVIQIASMTEGRHSIVHNKIFKRCLIKGPVRLGLLNRNSFNLNSSTLDFFHEVPAGYPRSGVILLENVEFFECIFDDDVCLEATAPDITRLSEGVVQNQDLKEWKKLVWTRTARIKNALTRS